MGVDEIEGLTSLDATKNKEKPTGRSQIKPLEDTLRKDGHIVDD